MLIFFRTNRLAMKIYQVDAFSHTLFKGNPAAVVLIDTWLDDNWCNILHRKIICQKPHLWKCWMLKILKSAGLPRPQKLIFVDMPTLASSFVIFKDYTAAKTIQFHVKNLGIFTVHQQLDGKICMNFPNASRQVSWRIIPKFCDEALSKPFKNVHIECASLYCGICQSVQDVLDEQPNLELLKQLGQLRTAITAQSVLMLWLLPLQIHSMTAYRVISHQPWALQKILLQVQFILQLHRYGQKITANRTCGISGFCPRWRTVLQDFA